MKRFTLAVAVGTFSLVCALASAQGGPDNDTPPLTAAQTAQSKAEMRAARAKSARLTPAQRTEVKEQMRFKRLEYLSALEAYSDNDMQALTAGEKTKLKAMRT